MAQGEEITDRYKIVGNGSTIKRIDNPIIGDLGDNMENVRILIVGGRNFTNYGMFKENVHRILKQECASGDDIEIVSGGALGVDDMADEYAREYELNFKRLPAKWRKFAKLGIRNAAGPARNEHMVKYTANEQYKGIVIAFWDGKSTGTRNTWLLSGRFNNLKRHLVKLPGWQTPAC